MSGYYQSDIPQDLSAKFKTVGVQTEHSSSSSSLSPSPSSCVEAVQEILTGLSEKQTRMLLGVITSVLFKTEQKSNQYDTPVTGLHKVCHMSPQVISLDKQIIIPLAGRNLRLDITRAGDSSHQSPSPPPPPRPRQADPRLLPSQEVWGAPSSWPGSQHYQEWGGPSLPSQSPGIQDLLWGGSSGGKQRLVKRPETCHGDEHPFYGGGYH